jgi:hypothetical protein
VALLCVWGLAGAGLETHSAADGEPPRPLASSPLEAADFLAHSLATHRKRSRCWKWLR